MDINNFSKGWEEKRIVSWQYNRGTQNLGFSLTESPSWGSNPEL